MSATIVSRQSIAEEADAAAARWVVAPRRLVLGQRDRSAHGDRDDTGARCMNAFHWKTGAPSVLANDRSARGTKDGRSWSQVASTAVKTRTRVTGVNPGTIPGLSAKADLQRKDVRRKS